jgi:type VI secretion system protein ImpK
MDSNFARKVDPIFLEMLELMQRIERNEAPVPAEQRNRIIEKITEAESALSGHSDWPLAKYAFSSWIDETLIQAPWDGRELWRERPLEFHFFRTSEAYSGFFAKAREAAEHSSRDALEVFYVCVVLGFRGLYRDASGGPIAEQMGLPLDLEGWARQTAASIRVGQNRPRLHELTRPGQYAEPLTGKFNFVGMALACACLCCVTGVVALMLFYVFPPS